MRGILEMGLLKIKKGEANDLAINFLFLKN